MKHRAAEFEKSLFNQESRRRLTVLLGRERRLARWMLGNVLSELHERAGSLPPSVHPKSSKKRCSSADYYVQQNIQIIKNRLEILWCVLPNVQQFFPGEIGRA